jgi:uncharacterized protein (DUF1015 family)
MAAVNEVKPFRALHYNPRKVSDIGACLSQPYDVISPQAQKAYYEKDPHNVIRLILGMVEPGDNERNNRYTRAADCLRVWKNEETLIPSDSDSFFAYEQTFRLPGIGKKTLSGFIGLVKLSAYGEGRVLPHELVMKKPVEDRVALTLATRAQFEYIWGLYRDPAASVNRLLERGTTGAPLVTHADAGTGVTHRLHRITDPDICRRVTETMREKQIYIADGHHRYQTMLNVRDDMRKKHPNAGPDAPWEYIMMFLVNAEHDGLVILPTHRLLHGLTAASLAGLETGIRKHFTVKAFPASGADEGKNRDQALAALGKTGGPAFVLCLAGRREYLLIELKDPAAYRAAIKDQATDAWKMLDVNVLNILVLGGILGFTDEMMSLQSNVEYCKDAEEAFARTASGEMQAAFILKGTPLFSVLSVADADEKMPRKSTFFYPKPLSGLVFYEMA